MTKVTIYELECPTCKIRRTAGAYCNKCGSKLITTEKVWCKFTCGSLLEPGVDNFCINCGKPNKIKEKN